MDTQTQEIQEVVKQTTNSVTWLTHRKVNGTNRTFAIAVASITLRALKIHYNIHGWAICVCKQ